MYTDRSMKKVLMLAVYLAAIILGIYMTFFHKTVVDITEEQNIQQELVEERGGSMIDGGYDYTDLEFPDMENESVDELYSAEGSFVASIYFSNTEKLDNGVMPLEVQAKLVQHAQEFLEESGYEDVSELYIEENSYEENEERITFLCYMDGYEEIFQIEYNCEERSLAFCILPS